MADAAAAGSAVVPVLRVDDLERSLAFYRDGLGFELVWRRPLPDGEWAELRQGALRVYLAESAGGRAVWVYFYVPDADACHRALLARGVATARWPQTQPWGNREFELTDPDGHRLIFAAPPARPTVVVHRRASDGPEEST
ncbi:MAG: glyoxalase [Gammaproteobacteria bacterium]|nr:MAG: glyoxalase [Gammaproteobacteria bacterium]